MVKADAALEREIPFLSIALGDAFSQTIMENPAILESVIVVEASPKEDLEMLKKWRNVLPLIDASKHFKPTLKLQLKDALSDPDYESKIRTYHTFRALVSRVHLHVRNHSEITAHDVRIEITIPHSPGLIILDEHPESPVERLGLASIAARVGIHRVPSDIFLKKMESGYHIEVLAGKIQAGAAYWTDDFLYIGSSVAQVISPFVRIYSDELRQPMTQGLPIRIQIKKRVYDKSEWEAIDKLDEQ